MGHQVELCDLSAEMLDLPGSRSPRKGLEDRIRLIHCPIQALRQHLTGTFDLVLCHAVLEWLAEPRQTLLGLFPFVKPGAYCRCFLQSSRPPVSEPGGGQFRLCASGPSQETPDRPDAHQPSVAGAGLRLDRPGALPRSSARPGCASSTTTCATSRIRSRSSTICSPWSSNIAVRNLLSPLGATSM